MSLTKNHIKRLYRERAGNYDFSANLYYLIGFRDASYRKLAISKLGIKEGNTAVEIGCGTGLNFEYALDYIGKTGKLIGIDLTDAMLEKAKDRVLKNNWENIELVNIDAAKYEFPQNINAVYSSFVLNMVPEYEEIINNAYQALTSDGKLVILDLKQSEKWPLWVVKFGVLITKPFGISLDLLDRKPWEVMEKYFKKVTVQEIYGGFVYIAVGEKS
jgi:demethylmenaquinone methyltransferase/2-methoxy-6-polyprenyl-1,4-benzoquinol methylase